MYVEFRKMVIITLYAKQKKRHRFTEQTLGLCGRRWGWDVLTEQHWNKYIIKGETDHSPGWMHGTSAQGWCTGKTQRDGMGRELGGGLRWGTHVNPWLIHVNVWQKPLQYYKVISLQLILKKGGKKSLQTVNAGEGVEKMLLHCWEECKWIQPLWKTI